MASASLRISTFYLGIVTLGILMSPLAHADEPEIEAKAYDLRIVRPSRSGRVYLFQKVEDGLPVSGKIFLLRQGDTPVMALRVLKTYSDTARIAAKKLLPYEGFPSLAPGSEYRAFEKIGNKVLPVPPSPEDIQDLQDLESGSPGEIPALEPENPALEPENPASETPSDQFTTQVGEPGEEDTEIKETDEADESDEVGSYFPNFFTMTVGLLAKTKVPGPDTKFGGGMLYSRNLDQSYSIEGGFYYYKSSGDETGTTITTTIIPLIGNVRYNHRFNDLWTGYVYGGLYFPWVASNVGGSARQISEIQTIYPALGVGAFLQTGPNWYLRFNLGIDAMALGVALRF